MAIIGGLLDSQTLQLLYVYILGTYTYYILCLMWEQETDYAVVTYMYRYVLYLTSTHQLIS